MKRVTPQPILPSEMGVNWHGALLRLLREYSDAVSYTHLNYTPNSKAEDVSSRYVVHYKGKRKAWMC